MMVRGQNPKENKWGWFDQNQSTGIDQKMWYNNRLNK